MSIFNGKKISVEILGESHGEKLTMKVSGFPKFEFNAEKLNEFTGRRKASNNAFSTPRKEDDAPLFTGIKNNLIDGDFTVEILNNNVKSGDYSDLYGKPRPSHADYAWYKKDGALNFSGGGRFSARLTAPYCVVGGLCKQYLESRGILVAGYLQSVGKVQGYSYINGEPTYEEVIEKTKIFPSLDKHQEMQEEIKKAREQGDSVGGICELIVYNLPSGIGDNLFEGLEGKISSLLFSIPAVKGVEFGLGFSMANALGSEVNDELYYDENGSIRLKTNNNGGINGGISNGFNLTIRVAVKPTPSISKEQNTIDLVSNVNTKIKINGRHDACVAVRAVPCLESAVMLAILDEVL